MADGPRKNPTPTSRASLKLFARFRRRPSSFTCVSPTGCGAAAPQFLPNAGAVLALRRARPRRCEVPRARRRAPPLIG
eukprot:4106935-Alexandrium_andersonii.AAC.1